MPFSEKSKLSLFLDQYSKVLYNLFVLYVMLQIEGYQNILKLSWGPIVFTSYKAFLKKQKRDLKPVSVPYFLQWFLKKNVSLVISYISFSGFLYFVRYRAICVL